MIQVYINTKRGGFRGALPGINVKFPKGHAWDKVVFISPQPKSKIISEVKTKARKKLRGVVVPTRTYARGRDIIALVSKKDLGGSPTKNWGFQAVMQSNEGYAKQDSVLARKVNEYAGEHRFGGGNDYNCDPHAIDILAPPAKGESGEKEAQYKVLKKHTCNAAGKGKKAVIPMVYPGK
jgi:carbohydrate-binding DOMON domain-containing protein